MWNLHKDAREFIRAGGGRVKKGKPVAQEGETSPRVKDERDRGERGSDKEHL